MGDTKEFTQELQFPSDTSEAQRVQNLLQDQLKSQEFSEKVIYGIRLAVEEALVNAIKHGNQMDRAKRVQVRYTINPQHFLVEIEDEGPGFQPDDVPDPTAPENLERPCGRGLLLMRAYMTECEFIGKGNICRMRRIRE
jgi:serine/threonine-protein kinase RsbW